MLMGIGSLGVVLVVGLIIYYVKGSDPAAQPPIPYVKIDYAKHLQEQGATQNRSAASGNMAPGTVVGETKP
ncbi:MAG: hypothetical protein JWQ02_443 [Capsulimonas sp.]|jgi:hypothetical protein|nr:hypothetical protein [Capsulimonas sp.]